jgi:hypothetical protein
MMNPTTRINSRMHTDSCLAQHMGKVFDCRGCAPDYYKALHLVLEPLTVAEREAIVEILQA